jgi:hypothetical protein
MLLAAAADAGSAPSAPTAAVTRTGVKAFIFIPVTVQPATKSG